MKDARRAGLILAIWAAGLAQARDARAQLPVAGLIADARRQIEDLNADSAATLLVRVLDAPSGITRPQRLRALALLGAARLMTNRPEDARRAFRDALVLDPTLRVDSLASLHSFLLLAFDAARAAPSPPGVAEMEERMELEVQVPWDTTIPSWGQLPIGVAPSKRSDVLTTLALTTSLATIIWSDSQVVAGDMTLQMPVYGPDGSALLSGRYLLRVVASDSLGEVSPAVERVLVISRVPVDTVPLPAELDSSAFLPETVAGRRSSKGFLRGFAVCSIAGLLVGPHADDAALALSIAGSAGTACGLVGAVLLGGRVVVPEYAERNRHLREANEWARNDAAESNARALSRAPFRVYVEGSIR